MAQFNPWHSVSKGENAPNEVNAIIEIPTGSRAKYELDKASGMLKLDRVLYSSVYYPANYGFIPQTLGEDHDPLDIVVICSMAIEPLCLIEAKVIGVMEMIDGGEADDKIIAVANNDMSVSHINDVNELPPHFLVELKSFFEDYKKLEKKEVRVEDFLGKPEAIRILNKAIADYQEAFKDLK
ncbi:inorganic diphosphatase [Limibacter armeniacum]|uniref:inorganic diphosphatase n=1 Tax=Limibacter armeniacum TaxID=466084 RepID=UPI002FE6810C